MKTEFYRAVPEIIHNSGQSGSAEVSKSVSDHAVRHWNVVDPFGPGLIHNSLGHHPTHMVMPCEYDIKVSKSVPPVIHVPRPVPVPVRNQVKLELEKLERHGIIARVTDLTDWVSSMVRVRKKNGRVRICIDLTDLNKAILREQFSMSNIEDIATRLHGCKVLSTLDGNSGYFQIKLSTKNSPLRTFNPPFDRYR